MPFDFEKKVSDNRRFEKIEESRINILSNNNDDSSEGNTKSGGSKTLNTISEVTEPGSGSSKNVNSFLKLGVEITIEESNSCKNADGAFSGLNVGF